jgi:hypothetical protein
MVKISLLFAPILLVLSLVGYGNMLRALLDLKRPRDPAPDIFESAFFGIFFITVGVLIANFLVGLGTNPGPYVAAIGLALFIIAALQWQNVFNWNQLALLVIVTALISYFVGPVTFNNDAGLYHIPTMNWVAYQPAPLGLGNLESRLGFDSAWLLFESAFRSERYLRWSHLAVAEIAIRAVVVGWIANRLFTELANGWQTKAMAYFASILALSVFVFLYQVTSTDMPANLLAFCAWIAFCRLLLMDESERRNIGDREHVLLVILVALAVTIKLSLLPIILLPAFLLLRVSPQELYLLIMARRRAYAMIAAYIALWLGRNFMLTGCFIYPVDMTCTTVPWGVGAEIAKLDAAWITGWARHPGPEALEYADLFNVAWIPAWFERIRSSDWGVGNAEIFAVVVAAGFVFISFFLLMSFFFVARRDRSSDRGEARYLIWASFVCAAAGIVLWFLKGPDPRFSWAFFDDPRSHALITEFSHIQLRSAQAQRPASDR